jgi:hypothetical protein
VADGGEVEEDEAVMADGGEEVTPVVHRVDDE